MTFSGLSGFCELSTFCLVLLVLFVLKPQNSSKPLKSQNLLILQILQNRTIVFRQINLILVNLGDRNCAFSRCVDIEWREFAVY
jgi:hypothetical protein